MRLPIIRLLLIVFLLSQSGPQPAAAEILSKERVEPNPDLVSRGNPPVLELTVNGMAFVGPTSTPSGWTTIRLRNASPMLHFAVLERFPSGRHLSDQQAEIAPVFQNIMDQINGRPLSAPEAGLELPDWFGQIVFVGGPGFISPHRTAENTVWLERGNYLLECYVKTGGVFHSFNPSPDVLGMVHPLTVTAEHAETPAPVPTLRVTISAERGIQAERRVPSGRHTIAVRFIDQKAHEHHLGHDVHLARMKQDTDVAAIVRWMDWTQPGGLETPAPAEFLGGTHEMPAGATGYFTVDLEPGEYAWIAEVPDAESKSMFTRFIVDSP